MRDYLNANEKNQFMVMQSILQVIEGKRNGGVDGPKIGSMLESWTKSNNMSKEEHKNLKMSETYLKKFITSVYGRLSSKERSTIEKKVMKFDFKLVDDYTLKQVFRDIQDSMANAVVPRQQFYDWTKEIMCVKCDGCTKDWNECELHTIFDNNFIPESGFDRSNCKYAYSLDES
jgi:hypothetical protein